MSSRKRKISTSLCLLALVSCSSGQLKEDKGNSEKIDIPKNCSVEQLYSNLKRASNVFAVSLLDTFDTYDLDCIKESYSDSVYKNLCALFFLKVNLSDLRRANQSYDVIGRCKGETIKMIDLYEHIAEGGRFLTADAVRNQIVRDTSFVKSLSVRNLLDSISLEEKRIIRQTNEIINSN